MREAKDEALASAEAHRDLVVRALALEAGAAARTAASAIIAHDATFVSRELAGSELQVAGAAEYCIVPSSGISIRIARDLFDQAVIDDIAALYAQLQAQATLDAELAPGERGR